MAYIVAAAITTGGNRYVTSAAYDAAPAATFLWKKTFPLGFYAPAVLPLVVSSLVATFENVGAITSAMEVSQLPVSGPEHLTRIQVRPPACGCCLAPTAAVFEQRRVLALSPARQGTHGQ